MTFDLPDDGPLLAGTDEMGYLLARETDIAGWEAKHRPRVDTTAPLG